MIGKTIRPYLTASHYRKGNTYRAKNDQNIAQFFTRNKNGCYRKDGSRNGQYEIDFWKQTDSYR